MPQPHRRVLFDDLPRCALCRRDVEQLTVLADPGTGVHTLTAYCHGQRDSVFVTSFEMMAMRPESVRFGVAFREASA